MSFNFDPEAAAEAKRKQREQITEDLRTGRKTKRQLCEENGIASVFKTFRIKW